MVWCGMVYCFFFILPPAAKNYELYFILKTIHFSIMIWEADTGRQIMGGKYSGADVGRQILGCRYERQILGGRYWEADTGRQILGGKY